MKSVQPAPPSARRFWRLDDPAFDLDFEDLYWLSLALAPGDGTDPHDVVYKISNAPLLCLGRTIYFPSMDHPSWF